MFPGLKTRHKILTVLKIEDTTPFLFCESLLWINKRPHSLWLILKPYSTASKICSFCVQTRSVLLNFREWTAAKGGEVNIPFTFLVTGILDNFKIKILQEILFKSLSKETKIRYILSSNFYTRMNFFEIYQH